MAMALPANIPSPSINSFHIGPLVVHFYALAYLVGIAAAIIITRRRWRAVGGDPDIVGDIALWSVPAGIIGGRIYFDITTPMDIPHVWYGVFAVWDGGLGIWGGIALATVVGLWRLRRHGVNTAQFMDAVAPALLVAQGIWRIGNYFNKELFGSPTSLPWGLEIPYQYRLSGGIPDKYLNFSTFQPTFLYELIFDFAWAGVLVWLGHHRKIKPPGLFALYVFGYSAYRIFEESLRIDSSVSSAVVPGRTRSSIGTISGGSLAMRRSPSTSSPSRVSTRVLSRVRAFAMSFSTSLASRLPSWSRRTSSWIHSSICPISMCACQESRVRISAAARITARYSRTVVRTTSRRSDVEKPSSRPATSKLAARRTTSHSQGPGSVSSKSLMSNII